MAASKWRNHAVLGIVLAAGVGSHADAVDRLDMRDRDTAVPVCSSPYRFVSGHWLDSTPVPADASALNRFSELAERARQQRLALVDQLGGSADPAADSAWSLFARSTRDGATVGHARVATLQALLPAIAQVKRSEHVVELLHQLSARGVPVWLDVRADALDADAVALHPTALTLGDTAHYLDASDPARELLGRYRSYIEELLTAAGTAEVGSTSAWVIDFEIKLAFALAQQAPSGAWRATSRQLHKRHPHIEWNDLFKALDAAPKSALVVQQVGLFDAFDALIESAPPAQWRAWLQFRILHALAPAFDEPFRKPYENFFGGILGHIAPPADDRERLLAWSETWFRPELAQRHLQTHLPAARATAAQQIFASIKASLAARIGASELLDEAGRQAALARLEAIRLEGIDPTPARSFDGLQLSAEHLAGNLLALRRWQQQGLLRGSPRPEPGLLAPVLRFHPERRSIQLSAATLQAPLFDEQAETGLQHAGLGSLLARALLRAVFAPTPQTDDEGASAPGMPPIAARDAAQALWQSTALPNDMLPEDAAAQLVLDVQSLALAHAAWQASGVDRANPMVDGHTPEQRLLLGWAALWRENRRPAAAPGSDPHAWRVDLALFQQPEFAKLFGCASSSIAAERGLPRNPNWP